MATPAERVQSFVDAKLGSNNRNGIVMVLPDRIIELHMNDLKALLAANDRHNRIVGQVAEMMADIQAHQDQEGAPVEIRTRNGSWRDASDYTSKMVRNMG